jgi:hypothetical protein
MDPVRASTESSLENHTLLTVGSFGTSLSYLTWGFPQ